MSPAPSPEARFVVAAVREEEGRSPGAAVSHAAGVANWTAVVDLAARNGVTAYVRRRMARLSDEVPAKIRASLRDAEIAAVGSTLALDAELSRVVSTFRGEGLETLVLKGPVLARTLYPEVVLRPYSDVDIVVRTAEFDRAARCLAGLGFRELPYEAEIARVAFADAGAEEPFHRMFLGPADRSLIELHADPLQLGLRPVQEDARWRRAVPLAWLASEAVALSDEDQVVQLAVHVHKHGFSRLIWLKDLDMLVRRRGAHLDWDLVRSVSKAEGVGASVWFALSLARDVLGTPRTPADALAPSPPIRALYELTWPRARVAALEMTMRRRAVQFHAAESWRGTLPTLVLMGRRRERLRLMFRALRGRGGARGSPA